MPPNGNVANYLCYKISHHLHCQEPHSKRPTLILYKGLAVNCEVNKINEFITFIHKIYLQEISVSKM